MKKIFCFLVFMVSFLIVVANSYEANAVPGKDFTFTDDSGIGGGGKTTIAYTGIEATLHEKGMGNFIINGGSKYERWDLYIKANSDGLVDFRNVSNLYLVSYLGDIYPIEGFAEHLNGIVDFNTPEFRVLESQDHFFSGKKTSGIEKADNYKVFTLPSNYAVVHYQNGDTDKNFNLAKATNSDITDPTYLLYKFESNITRYYMFKNSEVGTTSKIDSGFIYNDSISVAHIYTKFNSISEFDKTSSSNYYYIYKVLFIH
ncbi:MAG: hypothetical protein K2N64_03375 [Anaeroplasmataceae bacterium]|nr:hypothetical protein [Anaeroplasmataceae bacterium]